MGRSERMAHPGFYRAAVRWFMVVVASMCVALLSALFIYDPLMLFHAPWGRPWTLHESMRLQAAGIINNADFDGLILGTSMTENTSAEAAGRLLGGRFVNLSVTASDYFERGLLLEHAIRRRDIRQVIYSLDAGVFGREGHRVFHKEAFDFLYDRNPLNDFRAYMTPKFLECLARFSLREECVGREASLDRPNAWYWMEDQNVRFGGLDNWFRARNDWQVKAALASIAEDARRIEAGEVIPADEASRAAAAVDAIAYVDRYVLRHVEQNPQTRFFLFFPPYSRIRFAQWHQLALPVVAAHEAVVRHLAERAAELGNLELLGFEDQGFPDDIAWYKDTGHYRDDIDMMILVAMAEGTHRLTASNVDAYLGTSRTLAMGFDLVGLGRRIRAYLDEVEGAGKPATEGGL
ncbi:MAG: hypothetical protein RBS10_02665 [Thauera propionica]|jgi:hypothetical protein|nr:hypothetical protein [Thauera propionica]